MSPMIRTHTRLYNTALLALALCSGLSLFGRITAGESIPAPVAKPATTGTSQPIPPVINDEDLRRVSVAPVTKFPWIGKPPTNPPKPKPVPPPVDPNNPNAPPPADNPMAMSGDMVVKSLGPFTREERKSVPTLEVADKEVMTLTQNVEIEVIETQSVLRGEHIVIVKDLKSGDTELIEAKGKVELVSPDRTGKGEMMRFEMQKSETGEILKNGFTLIGDPTTGKKATLWLKKDPADPTQVDVIEAIRFVRDERLDTFKATGAPNAIITSPDDSQNPADPTAPKTGTPGVKPAAPGTPGAKPASPKPGDPATPKPKAPAKPPASNAPGSTPTAGGASSGGMGSLNMNGGGKVNMRCDAELSFDGATGKLKLTRNVIFIKEGLEPGEGAKIYADDALVTLDVPPPGAPPVPGNALGGEMKTLECFGRVEIKTGASTILCDTFKMDNTKQMAYFEMNNKSDTVLVYNQTTPLGGDVMIIPKTLNMNMDTREMEPGGPMKTRSFGGPPGSNRGNGPKPEDVKPLVDPKAKVNATDSKKAAPKPAP
ncbi:MAG: hypothetical protein WCT04_04420 [Planctomycetota bacterium]